MTCQNPWCPHSSPPLKHTYGKHFLILLELPAVYLILICLNFLAFYFIFCIIINQPFAHPNNVTFDTVLVWVLSNTLCQVKLKGCGNSADC